MAELFAGKPSSSMYHLSGSASSFSKSELNDIWILDCGSSRHLVGDEAWSDAIECCNDACVQFNVRPLNVTKDGSLTLRVTVSGKEKPMKLTDVYFAPGGTKGMVAKQLELFLAYFKKNFNCKNHVLRTDSGGDPGCGIAVVVRLVSSGPEEETATRNQCGYF
ncbi:uncharacterized protein PITG_15113 [Phytophthora infestans T30-4]|uniref:Uncharacterized protein n=1 Tax=Phytophthora infestans (strain T30-4) TaxID=403677 RepID=D0NRP5_PHYIT|nr:uncharacterized protein PITG_15113 [Phytophthora infestans T30-4]EEY63395.1 hypothetical protein PITG_15113 [Phytophthora infestans T30-4]|eukprot:XP_002898280.1 hypothetical protein PITG_15113 [Phytophthora infestans T30-4]